MVYIHGGGGIKGNSNPFNGIEAVEQSGIVLVTVNYRLSSFGFLALPGLDADKRQWLIGESGGPRPHPGAALDPAKHRGVWRRPT